jgi:hypothetical protein
MPYVYIQTADKVHEYECDEFGNLIEICFVNCYKKEGKKYTQYTEWNSLTVRKVVKCEDKTVSDNTIVHALGVIPVISVYSTDKSTILPLPPLYDLAKINYSIFNKDSEIRDQERSQAFSVFYMQTDSNTNNITLGSHNAILIPAGADITITPGYASPDSNILTVLNTNTQNLIDSIYRIAGDNGITGIKSATSGIAESYKFVGKNQQLIKTVNICETYEKKLAILFGLYTKKDIKYIVNYTKDYNPTVAPDNIDNVIKLLGMELPIEVKNNIKRDLISKVLDYMDPTELDKLLTKIEEPNINNKNDQNANSVQGKMSDDNE